MFLAPNRVHTLHGHDGDDTVLGFLRSDAASVIAATVVLSLTHDNNSNIHDEFQSVHDPGLRDQQGEDAPSVSAVRLTLACSIVHHVHCEYLSSVWQVEGRVAEAEGRAAVAAKECADREWEAKVMTNHGTWRFCELHVLRILSMKHLPPYVEIVARPVR